MAVWREIEAVRLIEEGKVGALFIPRLNCPTRSDLRAKYLGLSPTNHYRVGLELTEVLERKLGRWFMGSCELPAMILQGPITLISERITVPGLKEIGADSMLAPDARLKRLASLDI